MSQPIPVLPIPRKPLSPGALVLVCAALFAVGVVGGFGLHLWLNADGTAPTPAPTPTAQPTLSASSVTPKPYTLITVQVDNLPATAAAAWRVTPALAADQKHQMDQSCVWTAPPGVYSWEVYAVDFDARKLYQLGPLTVTVGDPGPTPPVPPVPPTDPFAVSVQAAWATETDPAKVQQAAALAQVYQYGVTLASTAKTVKALSDGMESKATALGVNKALPAVRKAIDLENTRQIPTTPTAAFDPAKTAAHFNHVISVLGALK